MKRPLLSVFVIPLLILLGSGLLVWTGANQLIDHLLGVLPPQISGTVVGPAGAVAGAIVHVQGSDNQTTADSGGKYALKGFKGSNPVILTAWAEGYYVGWVKLDPRAPDFGDGTDVTVTLKPLYESDNVKYPWFSFGGVEGTASCGLCHREYEEWQADAHSQSAVNPRFLSIYQGTDVHGNKSQAVRFDREGKALPPDPDLPYYGPGYRLDEPLRAGNCSTCHTPLAAKIPNQKNCGWSGCHTDLTSERANGLIDHGVLAAPLSGTAAEGISCDFCHKIGDVILNPDTGLPKADMPGILSYRLYRPDEGQQLFFGTVVDVNRRVSYLPLQSESRFCAGCHYGVFGGVVGHGVVRGGTLIYNSYGEWLESPYSDPQTGKTCQDCHMPVVDSDYFVFPEKGGIARSYVELNHHTMPGASDEKLLQNSVTMTSSAQRSGEQLEIEVSITNDQTGHHIPTDSPSREMILVVEATDAAGNVLQLVEGPVLPEYSGNFAGQPGKSFAKVLRDEWTGEMPTVAYWRPVTIALDTRLAALATDITRYTFALPAEATAQVRVRLLFRRTFQAVAQQKGFTDPDILMEEITLQVKKSR